MKRNILIISIVVFVVAIATFFLFRNKKDNIIISEAPKSVATTTEPIIEQPKETQESTTVNSGAEATKPEEPFIKPETDRFDIKTNTGIVSVVNVYKKSVGDGGFNGTIFKDNDLYFIAYYPSPEGFIISIRSTNTEKVRLTAEGDFIETLKISKTDACKLNVSLSVPMSIDENLSGQDFGLSFCPNGKAFPK
ncbi:MAG: hypothetical protein WC842_01395 [Candidatus Paceibacterota bacterium]|jgi:hypothetical protein